MTYKDDDYQLLHDITMRQRRRRMLNGGIVVTLACAMPATAWMIDSSASLVSIMWSVAGWLGVLAAYMYEATDHTERWRMFLRVLDQRDSLYRERRNALAELHELAEEHGVTTTRTQKVTMRRNPDKPVQVTRKRQP